jgi:hypothetical protein
MFIDHKETTPACGKFLRAVVCVGRTLLSAAFDVASAPTTLSFRAIRSHAVARMYEESAFALDHHPNHLVIPSRSQRQRERAEESAFALDHHPNHLVIPSRSQRQRERA